MQRKAMLVLTGLIVFSLLISTVGSAQAQDPQPPRHEPTPLTPPHYPSQSGFQDYGEKDRQGLHPLSAGSIQDSTQASLTLGQSGLSFRYVQTFGTALEPYLADGGHLNGPNGLFMDASNSLYVAEQQGDRVLKYNSGGNNTLIVGHAGVPWAYGDSLANPVDEAVDASGNIWVIHANAVYEFDSSGTFIQSFPSADPWQNGTDNGHFDFPNGIAFDSTGDLYIADTHNQRIQVFDVSGPTPIYVTTIGTTGIVQTDNTGFFAPSGISFDSSGRLYVVDKRNYRIQRCTNSSGWTCETFFGVTGVDGSDLTHLEWPHGIGIRNDVIYIADTYNYRVLKCTIAGVCTLLVGESGVPGSDNSHFMSAYDVAIDSSGNVFVSDWDNFRIQKFNGLGTYQSTIGVTGVPYLTDGAHLSRPWGVAINSTGEIYVTENLGKRLLKLNAAGSQLWAVGEPGVYGSDNDHFSDIEGNPAIDPATGRIFIPDTWNNRVQIFNSNGTYFTTLGIGWGTGSYEFDCPAGVAFSPLNGDVYVADRCNHRVQVFTSGLTYKATIGATGTTGTDNLHFNWPGDVTVDGSGNIYVSDNENYRVQKCILTVSAPGYSCTTFAGETGIGPDGTYTHIHPISVAVDASNRVYVVTDWDNRVQVYNNTGAFLTSIGGDWSNLTGGFRFPAGVAVDTVGNVYVTDADNHRVQKFAPSVPGWVQSNIDGFGDPNVSIFSLGTFNNALYAGGVNESGPGAGIWSTMDGGNWVPVMTGGFGNTENAGIDHLYAYNGYLFAGTYNNAGNAGQIWRSNNGTSWSPVTINGFGDVNNSEVYRFVAFNNKIYASTWNGNAGAQIWRDDDGAPHTTGQFWEQVVHAGFNDGVNDHVNNQVALSSEVYDPDGAGSTYTPYLFVGTLNAVDGAEVWRSATGNAGDWQWVNTNGFGNSENNAISALASFKGYLYAATNRNAGTGSVELWRCQLCDGSDWTDVTSTWSSNADTRRLPALEVLGSRLYLVMGNNSTGLEVWRSTNGTSWEQVGSGGLNTSINYTSYWDNALTVFKNELYLGTLSVQGGDVWKKLPLFGDVPANFWAWSFIDRLSAAGVTAGCGGGNYCPSTTVTRDQMAVFLLKGEHGSGYVPPTPTGVFSDVTINYWAASWIERLATEGVTAGCGGGKYCPTTPVTRDQMAVFLLKAEHGSSYVPPAATGVFSDVPTNYWAASWIERLAVEGITGGCGGGKYCPTAPVTRDQMAVFLVKTFNLP